MERQTQKLTSADYIFTEGAKTGHIQFCFAGRMKGHSEVKVRCGLIPTNALITIDARIVGRTDLTFKVARARGVLRSAMNQFTAEWDAQSV